MFAIESIEKIPDFFHGSPIIEIENIVLSDFFQAFESIFTEEDTSAQEQEEIMDVVGS